MRIGFKPPCVSCEESQEIDGVAVGKYYGDPFNRVCVEVISIENGIVAFRYMDPSNTNSILSMPKEAFLEKFFKYPNGCDFIEMENDIQT